MPSDIPSDAHVTIDVTPSSQAVTSLVNENISQIQDDQQSPLTNATGHGALEEGNQLGGQSTQLLQGSEAPIQTIPPQINVQPPSLSKSYHDAVSHNDEASIQTSSTSASSRIRCSKAAAAEATVHLQKAEELKQ